jgi:hypothetical protein
MLIIQPAELCVFPPAPICANLYRTQDGKDAAVATVRESLERTHHVMNTLDASPLTTIAAVHG